MAVKEKLAKKKVAKKKTARRKSAARRELIDTGTSKDLWDAMREGLRSSKATTWDARSRRTAVARPRPSPSAARALVPLHRDYDVLRWSQSRIGRSFG